MPRFVKRPPDALVVAVDFGPRPGGASALNAAETVVASNARGSLGVTAADSTGADVSAALLEGAPWIVAGTQVAFWIRAGVPGPYYSLVVTAPTSDGELLTERVALEVAA